MRIDPISSNQPPPDLAPLYDAVRSALGTVPMLMQVIGNSPAALEGYLGLNGALGKGALSAAVRERIALAVAETNGCGYCLAAHCALGQQAGLDAAEIERARRGTASESKAAAAVTLAREILAERGAVPESGLIAAMGAGLEASEIVEVVAHVALNCFTNFINNLAETEVDFPAAPALSD